MVEGIITFYGFMLAALEFIVNVLAAILTGALIVTLVRATYEGFSHLRDVYQAWRIRRKYKRGMPIFFLIQDEDKAKEAVDKLNEQYVRWELKRSYKMSYGRAYRIVPTTRKEESNEE